jgi:uncharacterized protein
MIKTLDWIAIVIVIIGGLNWGLIAFFGYDLIAGVFGDVPGFMRVLYTIVGIAAIYLAVISFTRISDCSHRLLGKPAGGAGA